MAFWPGLLFYALEYAWLKKLLNNVLAAAASSLITIPFAIIIMFYTYTSLLGRHLVPVDIAIFFIAIAAGQLAHYRIVTLNPLPPWYAAISVLLLLALTASFSLFTFYPPELFLFRDPVTGGYGIP